MPFQGLVNREFTTGFPGDILEGGPHRARVGRILSANDPAGVNTNRISRVFGWVSGYGSIGSGTSITNAARSYEVTLGGVNFFGVLFNPQHYALVGTVADGLEGGTLAPTLDLPQGVEAEFTDMCTALVVEIFNFTTGAVTINYDDQVAYVPNNISGANNPLGVPYGALVAFDASAALPTGLVLIPNARIVNDVALAASAVGALVSTYTAVQLTQ
jgi:hypothetical protein